MAKVVTDHLVRRVKERRFPRPQCYDFRGSSRSEKGPSEAMMVPEERPVRFDVGRGVAVMREVKYESP